MNKETIIKQKMAIRNALGMEIESYHAIWIAMEIMEKHGCQCIYLNKEERLSFQEHPVHRKRLALTYAVPTKEKNTLFSISQDLEKLMQDSTKYLRKSKMEWFLTTDTTVIVEISEA